MSGHPHFVSHSDWRETFRLSEVNDETCKLVIVTDDQIEILRRALKAAKKRQNWIDSEDADGYMTPDDTDWDETLALLDDLEFKLMSACDWITLDEVNERLGVVAPTPQAKLQVGVINQATNYADGIIAYGGDAGPGTSVLRAKMYAGGDALRVGGSGIIHLLGPVGIGKDNPSYTLDVNGMIKCSSNFGCNGETPRGKIPAGADATDLASVITLANQLKLALTNNGICS